MTTRKDYLKRTIERYNKLTNLRWQKVYELGVELTEIQNQELLDNNYLSEFEWFLLSNPSGHFYLKSKNTDLNEIQNFIIKEYFKESSAGFGVTRYFALENYSERITVDYDDEDDRFTISGESSDLNKFIKQYNLKVKLSRNIENEIQSLKNRLELLSSSIEV